MQTWNLTKTFGMNGKQYKTDAGTIDILNSIVPSAKANNDTSAVEVLMYYWQQAGRIVEIK